MEYLGSSLCSYDISCHFRLMKSMRSYPLSHAATGMLTAFLVHPSDRVALSSTDMLWRLQSCAVSSDTTYRGALVVSSRHRLRCYALAISVSSLRQRCSFYSRRCWPWCSLQRRRSSRSSGISRRPAMLGGRSGGG